MKKLMIAAAIVCVAVISHASSVQWGANGATASDLDRKMYLLTSISSTYESLAAFESAAIDSKAVTKVMSSYKVSGHEIKDDAVTTSANYYLALVDGNTIHYLDVTDAMRAKVYEPPASSPGAYTANFADVAGSAKTATIGGEPVPEPTSGLLLVLGLAGLALRRRRA